MALVSFISTTAKMSYATNTNIHQYIATGLEKEEIINSLTTVQEIMSSYAALSRNI